MSLREKKQKRISNKKSQQKKDTRRRNSSRRNSSRGKTVRKKDTRRRNSSRRNSSRRNSSRRNSSRRNTTLRKSTRNIKGKQVGGFGLTEFISSLAVTLVFGLIGWASLKTFGDLGNKIIDEERKYEDNFNKLMIEKVKANSNRMSKSDIKSAIEQLKPVVENEVNRLHETVGVKPPDNITGIVGKTLESVLTNNLKSQEVLRAIQKKSPKVEGVGQSYETARSILDSISNGNFQEIDSKLRELKKEDPEAAKKLYDTLETIFGTKTTIGGLSASTYLNNNTKERILVELRNLLTDINKDKAAEKAAAEKEAAEKAAAEKAAAEKEAAEKEAAEKEAAEKAAAEKAAAEKAAAEKAAAEKEAAEKAASEKEAAAKVAAEKEAAEKAASEKEAAEKEAAAKVAAEKEAAAKAAAKVAAEKDAAENAAAEKAAAVAAAENPSPVE